MTLVDSSHQDSSLDFTITSEGYRKASSELSIPTALELPTGPLQLDMAVMHQTYVDAMKWRKNEISEAKYWNSIAGAVPTSSVQVLDPGGELKAMCQEATFANPAKFVLRVSTVSKPKAQAVKTNGTYTFKLRIFPDSSHNTEQFPDSKQYLRTEQKSGKKFYEVDFMVRHGAVSFSGLCTQIARVTGFRGEIVEVVSYH